jgi:hypothetical protein
MKKNLILINLVLLAVSVVLAQKLRSDWARFQIENNLAHLKPVKGATAPGSPSADQPVGVTNYSTIVDKHLFAQDRNNIIPPEPPPEEHAKKLGPKPLLMGIMDLGEEQFAWMVSSDPKEDKDYRKVKVGESLGEYKLVEILDQKVRMNADGEDIEVRLNEPSKVVARDTGPVATGPSDSHRVTSIGDAGTHSTTAGAPASAGSGHTRPEDVPAGTIVNGRKKVVVPSPFGPMTSWVEVK